uniref:C2H2-type domain-containing protein n=1 Tax=Panagrolaimus sp. PS1159 TaxID=55785 RepID=A0AC35F0B0_9BILA
MKMIKTNKNTIESFKAQYITFHCNSQFDCIEALYEHIKTSHTSNKVKGQYICLWRPCKEKDPFQSVNRLNRHIKDKLKNKN